MARDAARQKASATRGHRIDTRFDEDELRRVRKVAGWRRLVPSAFVRTVTMDAVYAAEGHRKDVADPVEVAAPQVAPETVAELHAMRTEWRRVGVNLNQLVRLANRGQLDLADLRPVVEELRAQVDEVVGTLGGSGTP